jgi:hypothetical protein
VFTPIHAGSPKDFGEVDRMIVAGSRQVWWLSTEQRGRDPVGATIVYESGDEHADQVYDNDFSITHFWLKPVAETASI